MFDMIYALFSDSWEILPFFFTDLKSIRNSAGEFDALAEHLALNSTLKQSGSWHSCDLKHNSAKGLSCWTQEPRELISLFLQLPYKSDTPELLLNSSFLFKHFAPSISFRTPA